MKRALLTALLGLVVLLPSVAEAQRSETRHVRLGAPVKAVRQVGDAVYVMAGEWRRLVLCDPGPVCQTRGTPPARPTAPDGIPDGRVAVASGGGVTRAWYTDPTSRYDHGVLGDAVEGGTLVAIADGERLELKLSDRYVFEDLVPRLVDLDGDGANEIVTIRTDVYAGAALAIYGVVDGKIRLRAKLAPIGQPHRWLNIAGIADYSGDGRPDIAVVRTPHIGGTMDVWTLRGDRLQRLASLKGFSNHFIGSTELGMSATADVSGDGVADLIVPDQSRTGLRAVGLAGGSARILDSVQLPGRVVTAVGTLAGADGPVFIVGLDNGSLSIVWFAP